MAQNTPVESGQYFLENTFYSQLMLTRLETVDATSM
jgi:hypothetical protein